MKNELKPCTFIVLVLVLSAALWLKADQPPQFATIYQFGGVNAIPGAGLTLGPSGQLFGTTYGGAAADGTGSIYELVPNGGGTFAFNTLYRFDTSGSPPNDGQYPYAGLTLSPDGTTLYGTTEYGGTNGGGVFFSLNISQAAGSSVFKPRFGSFYQDLGDILDPQYSTRTTAGGSHATLIDVSAISVILQFFGDISDGGPNDDGFVFAYQIGGEYGKIVSFKGLNGAQPQGKLAIGPSSGGTSKSVQKLQIKANAATNIDLSTLTLYGVTYSGGSNNWGTVYSVRADGSNFMTLHHFNPSSTDGAGPMGGMVLSGNTLYGTTQLGGGNSAGTVFKINTDGSGFQIIENFDFATTGYSPQGDLILSGDTLYGTTYSGGTGGGGTVYSINTSGSNFMVLHSFTTPTADANGNYTNSDGGWSVAGLLLSGYTLYGTTPYGGTNGVGTAYEIMLPAPPSLAIAPAGGGVKISWPSSATNFVLQQNTSLAATNWSTNSLAVANDGTNQSVIISPPSPASLFFRLKQ